MSAQDAVNFVTITSPAEIAGDYFCIPATAWGGTIDGSLSGTGTFVDDGSDPVTDACEAVTNDLTGLISFADRGSCNFTVKAFNSQEQGAIATIVCNNDEDNPDDAIPMGGDDPAVTIPAVMISYNDCQTIRTVAEGGQVEISIQFIEQDDAEPCDIVIEYPEDVIWGQNGEGEFNGGLGDWTVECAGDECWMWTLVPQITGAFTGTTMSSPSACNGFMTFPSDFLDNGGVAADQGLGPCPAPCFGSLISPVIDLSGQDVPGLFLKFTQNYRQFQSDFSAVISYDEGATYTDTLVLNADAVVNSEDIKETVQIPISSYDGQESIRFKFDHSGNYYHWEIDDVALVAGAFADMQVNENWFAGAPQFKTPLDQASEMPFIVDIFNNGNIDAENVQVTVDIQRDGATVFTATNDYGVVDGFTLNENMVFSDFYIPDAVGDYTGTYTVSSESDGNVEDNDALGFGFQVTDNLFSAIPNEGEGSTLRNITDGSTWTEGGTSFTRNYAIARLFYIPNGTGNTITNVRFGLNDGDNAASGFVNVYLLQIPLDNDPESADIFGDETLIVGVNTDATLVISGGVERMNDIKLAASDSNGDALTNSNGDFLPVELQDNSVYAIVIATAANDDEQIGVLGAGYYDGTAENGQYSSGPVSLAFPNAGFDVVRTGTYIAALVDGSAAEVDAADFGSWFNINELFLEWTVEEIGVGTNDLNENLGVEVFPNPTSDKVWIDLNLENTSQEVVIELSSIDGKVLKTQTHYNVNNSQVAMGLIDVPTGIYNLTVRTEEGFISQKIVIE